MIFPVDYVGCQVIIRDDKTSKILAQSTITKFEKGTGTILVSGKLSNNKSEGKVSVLILYEGSVYEYGGTVRKRASADITEISLFNGKIKEERAAKRYGINTIAIIDSIIVDDNIEPLDTPLNVMLVNISKSGALVKAPADIFKTDDQFQLKIEIAKQSVTINSSIVRVKKLNDEYSEYACKFISLSK